MDRYKIFKVCLGVSGTRVTDLAQRWGVRVPTVCQVSKGVRRSRRLEALIDSWTSQVIRDSRISFSRKAA